MTNCICLEACLVNVSCSGVGGSFTSTGQIKQVRNDLRTHGQLLELDAMCVKVSPVVNIITNATVNFTLQGFVVQACFLLSNLPKRVVP